ncbi:receptor-type tyrosine-protein phosphatase kappa-like [Pomacea canaliculata]|uniref:receptor-type tyrosine-protein phosphatase kappa-like n=1 Tax=Pomacea canaliculata TaxID=400727 RepID=UPI000D738796|nr:receptor-type tyrosine-protein phosphatase kappa-like [Pomacea canaliculata]
MALAATKRAATVQVTAYVTSMTAVCGNGFYGVNCTSTCGNCTNGTTCDSASGMCPKGCSPGYQGIYCNEKCNYSYGINCSKTCGNCSDGTPCLPDSGMCPHGCVAGYQLPYCNENCIGGYYGTDCKETCGHCKNNVSCSTSTGLCPEGCEGSWRGDNCMQEAVVDPGDKTGVIAGVTVACIAVLIIAIVVLAVFLLRDGHKTAKGKTQHRSQANSGEDVFVKWRGGQRCQAGERSRVSSKAPKKNHGTSANILPDLEEECDHIYRNDESVYATFKASRPQLDKVQQTLIDLLASGQLTERFEELPKGLTDEHEAAKLPVNVKKNRYYSVLPYDKNRVVLTDGFSEGKATDYINASYITGFHQQKTYIATQGPRENTVEDFWRMVWQEHITQIIMLTSLIEDGKTKCFEYWPERDRSQTYGPVTVRCVDVQCRANFFIRAFIIQMHASGEKREVEQLNFVAWPDHGVPTTTSLLNFWRFAKSRAPQPLSSPVLVHCTAGVGRTGAFIGLDIAYEHAVSGGDVHVYDVVKRMREERCTMVQAAEQFVFLHKAVLEAYTGRDTVIPSDRFNSIFSQVVREHPRIEGEFKKVIQMRSLAPDMSVKVAAEARNKAKIRNSTYLPADNHLVYLTTHVPGRDQFISAVYVSTYREYKGSILTQLPLEETLVDFWRMVDGCDVNTIVSLGEEKAETVKNICQFWPKDAGTSLTVHPYVICHISTFSLGSHLISYTLSLEKKKIPGCRQVQLLHYTAWTGDLPDDMTDLLGLMDKVDALCLHENNSGPVIIQCHDGVTRSGLFSTLWNVLSRLTSDKEIDVYMAVRETHSVIPHAMTSLEQYRYCYEVAQKRISDMNIYTNADRSTDMNIYSNM